MLAAASPSNPEGRAPLAIKVEGFKIIAFFIVSTIAAIVEYKAASLLEAIANSVAR